MVILTRSGAAITERNARESPLLRLPAELRNKIWHYVVDRNLHSFVIKHGEVSLKNPKPHRRALLRACRQIHHETVKLPINFTLVFSSLYAFLDHLESLSDRLLSAVDRMHLNIPLRYVQEREWATCGTEGAEALVNLLPNLKYVHIHYIFLSGESQEFIDDVTECVEGWLHDGREGQLELVATESTEGVRIIILHHSLSPLDNRLYRLAHKSLLLDLNTCI